MDPWRFARKLQFPDYAEVLRYMNGRGWEIEGDRNLSPYC